MTEALIRPLIFPSILDLVLVWLPTRILGASLPVRHTNEGHS